MSVLDDLRPTRRLRVIDLVQAAGIDVSLWKNFKGRDAAANPKYCYNWSFEQPDECIAVCLWHRDLKLQGSNVVHVSKRQWDRLEGASPRAAVYNRRARAFSEALELAFRHQLPVRVIVVDGRAEKRQALRASSVRARLLDPIPWAVTQYNHATGTRILLRGAKPTESAVASSDWELSGFEGAERRKFVRHRQREGRARRAKIREALAKNGGHLICEVKKCGFDFKKRYGAIGEGYAQVHHLAPLSWSPIRGREVKLQDLAIVCANCHAMIHAKGQCRPLKGLIP